MHSFVTLRISASKNYPYRQLREAAFFKPLALTLEKSIAVQTGSDIFHQ